MANEIAMTQLDIDEMKPDENGFKHFSALRKYGKGLAFGKKCVFDAGCTFGAKCSFGNLCTFGAGCTFGDDCIFDKSLCGFGECCAFGSGCSFDRGNKFGVGCAFKARPDLKGQCYFCVLTDYDEYAKRIASAKKGIIGA